ncbi:MAG: glycosyltransferase family 4 protein [Bradymonadia bacterium]
MTVLHLTRDLAPSGVGGLSTAVYGLVHSLAAVGCPGAVASFDRWRPKAQPGPDASPPEVAEEEGVPVLRLRYASHLPALTAWISTLKPSVICVHDALLWSTLSTLPVTPEATLYVAHVAQQHTSRMRGLEVPTMGAAGERQALYEATAVVAPSRAAAMALEAERHVHVLPLGIDVPERAPTGLPATQTVVYVGRLGDIKGTDVLLDAAHATLSARPSLRWMIVGGLPAHQKAERRWRRRWDRLAGPLAPRLQWRGWLEGEALSLAYADATTVVVPSRFETFGQVPLEAGAHGRAVVASNAGALSEHIEHGITGLLVPPGDAGALVEALGTVLDDADLARSLGGHAAARAQGHRWSAVAPRWQALFDTLASALGAR